MAITINGTANTVAGVAAGGINDNVVDNGTMADDAIGIAELSATGTASSSTFLRGDNAWAAAGGGKVVQVKYGQKSGTFTTASTTYEDVTGLEATITPTSTSNYIAIWAFINGNTTGSKSYGRIARDSTGIAVGDASSSRVQATFDINHAGSSNRGLTCGGVWVEQAQSTNETDYKVQVRHENGGALVYINSLADTTDSAVTGRYTSGIIVMEFEP